MSTAVGEDFTRVTVISPTRRIDLALPSNIALGEILPNIVRFSGYEPGTVQESVHTWVLQRAGDDPLDPNKLVSGLSIRDGEILHLRQRGAAMPDAAFDDVVDAVATATSTIPAWTPKHSLRLTLGVLATVLGGVPLLLLLLRAADRGWTLSDLAGGGLALGVSLAAAVAAIVASRAFGKHAVAATMAWTAVGLSGLGALFAVPPVPQPQIAALIAFAALLATSATMALTVRVHPHGMLATVLTSLISVIVTMFMVLFPTQAIQVSAIAAAVALVLMAALPQLSYQIAQIALPVLPSGAEQLLSDDEPLQSDIVSRAIMADRLLASFVTAAVMTATIFLEPLVQRGRWADLCLGAAVSAALFLRARGFVGLYQRLVLLVGGIVTGSMTLIQFGAHTTTGLLTLAVGGGVIMAGSAILVAYAARGHDRILSPSWGRIGDILEWIAVMAIIPLLLAVLDVYTFMLGLSG